MKKLFLLSAAIFAGSVQAWDCEHEKGIDLSLNVSGSKQLAVTSGPGDLEVVGHENLGEARVTARVCSSKAEWLDQTEVITQEGANASVSVSMPDRDSGWSFMNSQYLYVDLIVEVPRSLAIDIRDSSGDIEIDGTGAVTVQDSSGDIEIENSVGNVILNDSSGDIDLSNIKGDVIVKQDSSGDIYGRYIEGSVRVERDSSGDIRFRDVSGDYVVERDSSGDIVADVIGGDFRVERDGSGDIRNSKVSGMIEIPEES